MQDRFKFRIWDKDRKKMFDCIQINFTESVHSSNSVKDNECSIHLMYQPHLKLIQCTGLKDKNGNLIYEGDIVHKSGSKFNGEKILSEVAWSDMTASFWYSDLTGIGGAHEFRSGTAAKMEVLGNIYENSELVRK